MVAKKPVEKETVAKVKPTKVLNLYSFPDAIVDGVQGITIEAEDIEKATKKLNNLLK